MTRHLLERQIVRDVMAEPEVRGWLAAAKAAVVIERAGGTTADVAKGAYSAYVDNGGLMDFTKWQRNLLKSRPKTRK